VETLAVDLIYYEFGIRVYSDIGISLDVFFGKKF